MTEASGRTLLYVEDEDAAFLLFETALKDVYGSIRLHRASNGEQALGLLRGDPGSSPRVRPDLVVLDLNLPRKTGLEVLEEIKNDPELRAIIVVVFTSSSLASDRNRCIALGALDYLTKPFTYDAFLESVTTLCSYLPAVGRA